MTSSALSRPGTRRSRYLPPGRQAAIRQEPEPVSAVRQLIDTAVADRIVPGAVLAAGIADGELFYVCSLDRRRIVYKGLLTCKQLRLYYPDLSDERVTTSRQLPDSAARDTKEPIAPSPRYGCTVMASAARGAPQKCEDSTLVLARTG